MTLMSFGTGGLFSNSGSWRLCAPSGEMDSESNNQILTTAFVSGAGFMPQVLTIDGFALKFRSPGVAPTGVTANLTTTGALSGITVTGTRVVLTGIDLPTGIGNVTTPDVGWIFFKFTGNFTTVASQNYFIQVRAGGPSALPTLYSSGAANNWSRLLRTVTGQAPVVNDKLIIVGEYSGANSGRGCQITMDINQSGSGYGSIWISRSGVLDWKTNTNTYLSITGTPIDGTRRGMEVCASGRMDMGTSGTPIQSGITGILEFACTSNAQFGLEARAGSIINIWGT